MIIFPIQCMSLLCSMIDTVFSILTHSIFTVILIANDTIYNNDTYALCNNKYLANSQSPTKIS